MQVKNARPQTEGYPVALLEDVYKRQLSFRTTLEAMEWEKQCNARQVPGRAIVMPNYTYGAILLAAPAWACGTRCV